MCARSTGTPPSGSSISGFFVCAAQMFRYMALAIAPVSVVAPIQRLSVLFRFWFARLFNPQHEVFGGKMVAATVVSLTGALALSVIDGDGAVAAAAAGLGW